MPCDTIQTNSLEIAKMHPALLRRALDQIGATGVIVDSKTGAARFYLDGQSCTIADGRFTVQAGYEHLADKVRVGYSRQASFYTAQKNGWKMKEVRPNVFQVIK